MNLEITTISDRLLSALANGIYQGLLLAAAVWLCFKLLPRLNAATRHAICFATLLVIAALPIIHFASTSISATESKNSYEPAEFVTLSEMEVAPAQTGEEFLGNLTWRKFTPAEAFLADTTSPPVAEATPSESAASTIPAAKITSLIPTVIMPSEDDPRWTPLALTRLEAVMEGILALRRSLEVNFPAGASLLVLAALLSIALIRLFFLLRQLSLLRAWKLSAAASPGELDLLFEGLLLEAQLNRPATLRISEHATAPLVVGFRRPAVLLPQHLLESAEHTDLSPILRHELAHLVRGDDWSNLLQQTIHALLFFHPAVWWLSHRLAVDREIACDDHVLALTKKPRAYALFLAEFATRALEPQPAAAPAAWSKKSQLKERISMILDQNRNSSPRPARVKVGALTTASILLAVLVLQAGPRLVLAQSSPPPAAPPAPAIASETTSVLAVEEESGPRSKEPSADALPAVAEPPAPPSPVVSVHPRIVAVNPPVAAASGPVLVVEPPRPTRPARPPQRESDPSLEHRMQRLEQMLQELLANQKHDRDGKEFGPKPRFFFDEEKWKLKGEMLKPEQVEQIQKEARRASEQALKAAEAATREMQVAMQKQKEHPDNVHFQKKIAREQADMARRNVQQQRQILQAERKVAEQQLRLIARHLEELEREQEKMEAALEAEAAKLEAEQEKSEAKREGKDNDRVREKKRIEVDESDTDVRR